ncbi:MAG: hypothetical protein H6R15_924 [Proteobacteria bacterium]|nr:hypothetical protein [Pseudomonadota bacterium]
MTTQFDPISSNINFFRNLSRSLLDSSEEFLSWQIDSAQAFITRNSKQLKSALAEASDLSEPEQWPATMQNTLLNAFKLSQDYLLASTEYQLESMRQLQEQSVETQKTIAAALTEQFALGETLVTADQGQAQKRRLAA